MSKIVVGVPYLEPTQWCVDVWIDDGKNQLTWEPVTRECPSKEEIDEAVTRLATPPPWVIPDGS